MPQRSALCSSMLDEGSMVSLQSMLQFAKQRQLKSAANGIA